MSYIQRYNYMNCRAQRFQNPGGHYVDSPQIQPLKCGYKRGRYPPLQRSLSFHMQFMAGLDNNRVTTFAAVWNLQRSVTRQLRLGLMGENGVSFRRFFLTHPTECFTFFVQIFHQLNRFFSAVSCSSCVYCSPVPHHARDFLCDMYSTNIYMYVYREKHGENGGGGLVRKPQNHSTNDK